MLVAGCKFVGFLLRSFFCLCLHVLMLVYRYQVIDIRIPLSQLTTTTAVKGLLPPPPLPPLSQYQQLQQRRGAAPRRLKYPHLTGARLAAKAGLYIIVVVVVISKECCNMRFTI